MSKLNTECFGIYLISEVQIFSGAIIFNKYSIMAVYIPLISYSLY